MKTSHVPRWIALVSCVASAISPVMAQTSVKVFSPVDVRLSADGTGAASPVAFNSSTLNLTCPAAPITAVLSSTADGRGNLLVDNSIVVTATSATSVTGPVNVCLADRSITPGIVPGSCVTYTYQRSAGSLVGQDPDTFVNTGGVAPIDIGEGLQSGPSQVQINLVDTGGLLASSTVYLDTNCAFNGVTGPAEITGNPISKTNPTAQQLSQNFAFNTMANQQVKFVYDLSKAYAANTLSITNATIPGTEDQPVPAATFQPAYLSGTSFATANCLIHSGESAGGHAACKLFTLACTVGTGATDSGAQCPVSSLPNEIFQDIFDGPGFTLPDISTPNGPAFHEGIGFLMASEGWTGGPCTFDPASGLQDLTCPQNLLTDFSGPGLYLLSGGTSHPNSTFVALAQVPEDLTTVTVANQQPGGWINSHSATVTLSSQPPVLTGTNLPGAAAFVPSPIRSITYGSSLASDLPVPAAPPSTDVVVTNSITCPVASNPLDPPATPFTTNPQAINFPADGSYLLHYYAQDCAGTRELHFVKDANSSWSTNYYTFPINVDTVAPIVASGPTLSPAPGSGNSYTVGQAVSATYSCTDERSGLVRCGATNYSYSAAQLNSGTINSPVDTSTPGPKTYTVAAVDAAGNHSSASVNYTVVAAYDAGIELRLSRSTIIYPQRVNAFVRVAATNGHVPTGKVQLYDGSTLLRSEDLRHNGTAHFNIGGFSVGVHPLSAVYSGDRFNTAGKSAPVTLTVNPTPSH